MKVTQLWRYPVKSMAGERLQSASVGDLGIEGDRGYGVVDLDTGLVLTARRVPDLLLGTPVPRPGGSPPSIRLPDGTLANDDRALGTWLERRVELRGPRPDERGRYEIAENDDNPDSAWIRWQGPEGIFHDSSRTRVSIVSEDSLGEWDVRRFRPNIVIDGGDERDLLGRTIRIGELELEVVKEIDRCVIVTRPQPGLERDKNVLVQVHRTRSGNMGVGGLVRAPGDIAIGDPIELRRHLE